MKRATKILLGAAVVVVAVGGAAMAMNGSRDDGEQRLPAVEVTRGHIVDKALAVGTIEPRVEISVKSQFSGVIKRQFAEVGEYVQAGTALLEIQPNPTPQELVDAERRIEMRELELKNLQAEFERQRQLFEKQLISAQEYERAERTYEESRLQLQIAREQLALLREGRVSTDKGNFETVVRAPVSGYILDRMVEVGDPVVPLTSYQEGTVLMTMANMDDLIFRGTVDEIDVGRLQEGMPAEIKVGALPHARVTGRLAKIWLKARKEENSTVFPVEIEILEAMEHPADDPEAEPRPVVLRAGYSANTEIIIEQRENVLLIPERVIEFRGDTATVRVRLPDNTTEERVIQTGLSDAINIEVVSGLQEGEFVAEKPPREIE
ncbi:efflux transporter periplasmic adaptor subunit [Rhodothermaceae bacterium RA]|nr:efflux transporter periplasmic adaptor subunit [Rhodothermaceae bacterium RA]